MYKKIKLDSKINEVYRVIKDDNSYISKTFKSQENLKREVEILRLLKKDKCNVPDIIKVREDILLLEDLGDTTLLDWYEMMEKKDSKDYSHMIYKLADWFNCFYSSTSNYYGVEFILWDINFRNFIIKEDEIYGVDFEKCMPGNISTDLGRLSAFALTYDPIMTDWKREFSKKLINAMVERLKIEKRLILQEQKREFGQIEKRRDIKIKL